MRAFQSSHTLRPPAAVGPKAGANRGVDLAWASEPLRCLRGARGHAAEDLRSVSALTPERGV